VESSAFELAGRLSRPGVGNTDPPKQCSCARQRLLNWHEVLGNIHHELIDIAASGGEVDIQFAD